MSKYASLVSALYQVYDIDYQPRTESSSLAKTTHTIPESLMITHRGMLDVFSKEFPTYSPIREVL